jgi:hypothetical protein
MNDNGGMMMMNEEDENLYGDEEMLLHDGNGEGMAVQDYVEGED